MACYVGRFAPSPTGPLHFGSLVAAAGSFLRARAAGGRWLVRMENLDPPREMPGADSHILRTLEAFGLWWDGPVLYQSTRLAAYEEALENLVAAGAAYYCVCSRKDVLAASNSGVYPGTCRGRRTRPPGSYAVRVQTSGRFSFQDALQGAMVSDLEKEAGDFVVQRADGYYAYQLAVVVDDAYQDITEVVRGADLLDSTPRQIHLQRLLGLPTPDYLHLPVAVNGAGEKLSKQTGAPALDASRPETAIVQALEFLGMQPPPEARDSDLQSLWAWAISHFDILRLPRRIAMPISG